MGQQSALTRKHPIIHVYSSTYIPWIYSGNSSSNRVRPSVSPKGWDQIFVVVVVSDKECVRVRVSMSGRMRAFVGVCIASSQAH